ncbi:MAG: hypothetical protein E7812_13855 [Phenylobacterium sp.]|nr:MAG: hypothetical protein E7812_13855 [Phenylobacterium sp.]
MPPFAETVTVRVAGRLGMAFFLDILRIACDGHQLLDGLILLTIGHANVEYLERDAAMQARFADYDDVPDDDLLRPISISAVANSLGQPFETIRRRTAALREAGACATTGKGLIIPPAELGSDRHKVITFAINQKVRALEAALEALGLLRPHGAGVTDPRVVARLAIQCCLRQLEAMTAHIEDPTVGVLLIHVIRATTEHLDDTHTELSETEDLMSDDLRRPAPVSLLTARVGLPPETVRRHLGRLHQRGWIARSSTGYYLTRDMLRAPPWPQARRDNVVNLNRLFAGLGRT